MSLLNDLPLPNILNETKYFNIDAEGNVTFSYLPSTNTEGQMLSACIKHFKVEICTMNSCC